MEQLIKRDNNVKIQEKIEFIDVGGIDKDTLKNNFKEITERLVSKDLDYEWIIKDIEFNEEMYMDNYYKLNLYREYPLKNSILKYDIKVLRLFDTREWEVRITVWALDDSNTHDYIRMIPEYNVITEKYRQYYGEYGFKKNLKNKTVEYVRELLQLFDSHKELEFKDETGVYDVRTKKYLNKSVRGWVKETAKDKYLKMIDRSY